MSGNARAPLRSVLVAGGGIVALVCAIALRRALPGTDIVLVRTALDETALADRFPVALPSAAPVLADIGLDEETLVRAGAATHLLGDGYDGCGPAPFGIGTGRCLPRLAGVALPLLLLAHHRIDALDALTPPIALLRAGRYAPDRDAGELAGAIEPALRVDPVRLAALLTDRTRRSGVRVIDGGIAAVDRQGGIVRSLRLTDGAVLSADLYLDASGPAPAIARGDRIDWQPALGRDRLVVGTVPGPVSLVNRYRRHPDRWEARWPGPEGNTQVAAFGASAAAPDGSIAILTGRLATPQAGNVVAIGDAAAGFGALGLLGFSVALHHLALLLDLMPGQTPEPLLVAEYNRRASALSDHVRDYAAAFHLKPGGDRAALSPGLAAALDQFDRRGRLPPRDGDMIPDDSWTQLLLGVGARPLRADPIALSVPHAEAIAAITRLHAVVAALPATMPPYAAWRAGQIGAAT